MATIAGTRPNHYEVLGLTPTATDEDIRQAFAREISPFRPRAIGGLADISIAYETLRDTARRRSYDASIGIRPQPAPPAPRAEGWHTLGSVHVGPIAQPIAAVVPRPEPEAMPRPAEPRVEPETMPRPAEPRVEPAVRVEAPRRPIEELRFPPADERPIEWRRPALVVGGLFAGVALLGAGLGWYASRDVEPAHAEAATTSVAPKPIESAAQPPSVVEPAVSEARPQWSRQPKPSPAPARHRARVTAPPPDNQVADDIPDIPSEQVVARVAPAAEPAATMPLSNAAIARTIGRIGYSCGSVASTEAVEGAGGAFKVTCTSGDSYRAAPVGGRYRFKRWSGR